MQKLLATTALIATNALAVRISNPGEYCCEVFSEANFEGVSETFCSDMTFFGTAEYTGFSFVGDDSEDGAETFEFIHDKMESYRCGSGVRVEFCDGAFSRDWN